MEVGVGGRKWELGAGKRDKLGTCADDDTVELDILRCRANILGTYDALTLYMQCRWYCIFLGVALFQAVFVFVCFCFCFQIQTS